MCGNDCGKMEVMMIRALILSATLAVLPMVATAQEMTPPPAGTYQLDPSHARLIFRVNHLGFSKYTAFFKTFAATLQFDPANPAAMTLSATVDPASVETHYPDAAVDFNATIAGPELLDAGQFPTMTFNSTAIALTGDNTADVTGDLTLHGVTKPVVLAVTFNGGYGANDMDPGGARIGFSATGMLKRSDFGMGFGVPAPGTTMGVFDEVEIIIEAEFLNADAKKP
jgi:polyisoprenoid-binding protein YceI